MQKFNYKLSTFIKAIEIIVERKGREIKIVNKSGSAVRFEVFAPKGNTPETFWVIHTGHHGVKRITSKQDYEKAAYQLCISIDEFIKVLEKEK